MAIAGKPNAGKSTLFNALVGERLAIITPKPQTTRIPLLGVLTRPTSQIVLWDTPGLLDPKYRLQEVMRAHVARRLRDSDVVLGLVDANDQDADDDYIGVLTKIRAPLIVGLNKTDLVGPESLDCLTRLVRARLPAQAVVAISALKGTGLDELLSCIEALLPFGPKLYPDEMLTDQPERFFVTELIREAVFNLLSEEVPYAIAVSIEEFREEGKKTYIRANICVERDSQRGIVIGARGRMLKRIGSKARGRIEGFLERPVYLDLWVKVRENWRKKDEDLREFGYA